MSQEAFIKLEGSDPEKNVEEPMTCHERTVKNNSLGKLVCDMLVYLICTIMGGCVIYQGSVLVNHEAYKQCEDCPLSYLPDVQVLEYCKYINDEAIVYKRECWRVKPHQTESTILCVLGLLMVIIFLGFFTFIGCIDVMAKWSLAKKV